jgi:hypothetical protein
MHEKLQEIIEKFPEALSNRQKLRALFMDYFPDKKRESNILLMVFDEDIVLEMRKITSIDNILMMRYVKILVDNYGIYEEVAKEGVLNWARAFKIEVNLLSNIQKTEEIEINKVFYEEKIEAEENEYEFLDVQDAIVIKKFIGFDQDEIIVPNEWKGKKILGIGENAFAGCTGIKKIVVSEGIKYIENGAFYNCTSLNKIVLPRTLQYLGKAGTGKHLRKGIYYGAQLNFMSNYKGVFENTAVTDVKIPISTKYIGERCFSNCTSILEINIPSGVNTIENGTFMGCNTLKQVKLAEGTCEIGTLAFYGCKNLSDIQIPQTVKEIGNKAFAYCNSLVNIELSEGVQKIQWEAFNNCNMLKKIKIPRSVTDISENSFDKGIVLYCYAGSNGLEYARKLGLKIENAAKA